MIAITFTGEAIDVPTRQKLTDAEVRRARDMAIVRLNAAGYSIEDIARMYNLTRRNVYYRLAAMPEVAVRRAKAM